ncbi:MAG: pseudaminic acid cytidylyltransferase [Candidatus Nanopelagicales bacterium]|nr:pseudaminic acid cytidylyltransferase [Candidatus Nanopelagicales bacterium]MDZ4248950.1 pseudaminic acid cytidylyltransferase [Candidatus Nanopelagicales bacterium]
MAIIPARGGSKRIPRKNIRMMSGRPLITWAVEAALASGVFDDVVVTTDDDEIASIAGDAGASIPFIRPPELSDDYTPTVPVIAHAVAALDQLGASYEFACCLYPAAIFLVPEDFAASLELLKRNPRHKYAATVTRYAAPVQEAMELGPDGTIRFLWPEHYGTRTQEFAERWHDAGQLYWGRREAWTEHHSIFDLAVGYSLPPWRVQDIDDEDDWRRAEVMHTLFLMEQQR